MITELFYSRILNVKRLPSCKKFSGVLTYPFLDKDELKWLSGPEKLPGFSRNRPLDVKSAHRAVKRAGPSKKGVVQ